MNADDGIDTVIDADPESIRRMASKLELLGEEIEELRLEQTGLMRMSVDTWLGRTASAYEDFRMDLENATRQLGERVDEAAGMLHALAYQIEYRKEEMSALRDRALEEGFSVEGFVILRPDPIPSDWSSASAPSDPAGSQNSDWEFEGRRLRLEWLNEEYEVLRGRRDEILDRIHGWVARHLDEVAAECFAGLLIDAMHARFADLATSPYELLPDAAAAAAESRLDRVGQVVSERETAKIVARSGNPRREVTTSEIERALERSENYKAAGRMASGTQVFSRLAGGAFVAYDVAGAQDSPSGRLVGGLGGIAVGAAATAGLLSIPGSEHFPKGVFGGGIAAGIAGDGVVESVYEYVVPLEWRDWFDEGIRDGREFLGFAW